MNLRTSLQLTSMPREWLNQMATTWHYMHRPVHARACPFGWAVTVDGELYHHDAVPWGFIVFAGVHFTKMHGVFGYPGLPTQWQVLVLSRLWLHDDLPHNSETCVIAKALRLVQRRWLEVHPPVFPDRPYHILRVLSWSDLRYHRGTIYRAANFREIGTTHSQARHSNTRGGGLDGAELRAFIYELPEPRWRWGEVAP